jgi:tetratricopeptide (TPR) repeat protein
MWSVLVTGPRGNSKTDLIKQPILKRRIALLRSLNRPSDAISALIQLLDAIPTDAEAWCELADLYQSQGLGSQAIFSLEEALLIAPNSWNVCTIHLVLIDRDDY